MTAGPARICASLSHPNVSVAPVVYNAAFRARGLDYLYVAFDVSDLDVAVRAIRALQLRGASVSRPFKERVAGLLDAVDAEARAIGAVNLIVNDDGRLTGFNTDHVGACIALRRLGTIAGRRAAVIGAGGAGRAVAYVLKAEGAEVVLVNRTAERAHRAAAALGVEDGGSDIAAAVRDAEIVVNATSVGCMTNDATEIVPAELLRVEQAVLDVVIRPRVTPLIAAALARGCRVAYGWEMYVHQAAAAFRHFTGEPAPVDVMTAAIRGIV